MTIAEMLAKAKELRAKAKAIVGLTSATPEQLQEAERDLNEAEALEKRAALAARAEADNGAGRGTGRQIPSSNLDGATAGGGETITTGEDGDDSGQGGEARGAQGAGRGQRTMVEFPRQCGRLRHFDNSEAGRELAYRFGMWLQGSIFRDERAISFCRSNGIQMRAVTENVNTSGGYFVPTEFGGVITLAAEQYGVVRANANVIPMGRDTLQIPVDNGSVTAYPIGELGSFTESNPSAGQLTLSAKKWGVITRMSSEVAEDAVIDLADRLAGQIGRAFAYAEDYAAINGPGGSTYHGITGLRTAIAALSSPLCSLAAASGTSTDWTKYTLAHFAAMTGRIQDAADANAKWYCSKLFWSLTMEPLLLAAGGNTERELAGRRNPVFLGYPVVHTGVLPKSATTAEITCLFGDLGQCIAFGDRKQISIAMSTDGNVGSVNLFETDSIGIRGTERFDIAVYNLGDGSNPGAVVGSLSAA